MGCDRGEARGPVGEGPDTAAACFLRLQLQCVDFRRIRTVRSCSAQVDAYPAFASSFAHSSGLNSPRVSLMPRWSVSRHRGWASLSRCLSLAMTCSIGLRSGPQGVRNSGRALPEHRSSAGSAPRRSAETDVMTDAPFVPRAIARAALSNHRKSG